MAEIRSRIEGIGGYVPPNVVTNDDLSKIMETSHEWIVERTGIEERRWVNDGEACSEMAEKASRMALKEAGLEPKDIDLIIFATLSPDFFFPGNGVVLQARLGIKEIPCFDIRQQCSGFIYGLQMADVFIRSGMYKKILLVGAELHSSGLDKTTEGRGVTVLFGDGAGAMVIGVSDDPAHQILSTHIHADGSEVKSLWVECPGSVGDTFVDEEDMKARKHYPYMNGKKVFKHAVTRMPQVMMEGMIANDLKLDDIDMLIPHQANLRINQMVAKMIGLPPERTHNNIQKLGNTTAATIPLCLLDAIEVGKVKRGDLLCFVAFGAGLTWGSAFIRY